MTDVQLPGRSRRAGLGGAVEGMLLKAYMKKLIEERGTYLKRTAEGRTYGTST